MANENEDVGEPLYPTEEEYDNEELIDWEW